MGTKPKLYEKRRQQLILVRGGGDIATGTIQKLCRCGYPVLVLETAKPSAIRRKAAFSEAVYDGCATIEGMTCRCVDGLKSAWQVMEGGEPALMVDPECRILREVRPWALVDAILAKKNLGTSKGMADKTIAVGPGFTAGYDVNLVVETMRGHNLGRLLTEGTALPNTGVPGPIGGFDRERVIHAPAPGILWGACEIGDKVLKGQHIAEIRSKDGRETVTVTASLTGILRGLIRDGYPVTKGFKIADIDPRESERENCFTISDKARCIAGSVLEGLLYLEAQQGR